MSLNRRDLFVRAGGAVAGMTALGQLTFGETARAAGPGCLWGAHAMPRGSETPFTALTNLEAQVGRKFTIEREYQTWGDPLPSKFTLWSASQGRVPYVGWNAFAGVPHGPTILWSSISNGSRDTFIKKQAASLKAWGVPIYLNFHHEPEDDHVCGTAAQFRAAYNHIHTLFDQVGVPNVTWVLTLMASTYAGGNGGPTAWEPAKYDLVCVDGYNRYPVKPVDFKSFADICGPARDFAIRRGKGLAIGEYGSVEQPDPNGKAAWLADAGATMKSWPELRFACYAHTAFKGFDFWVDTSASSLDAFTALGNDPYFV